MRGADPEMTTDDPALARGLPTVTIVAIVVALSSCAIRTSTADHYLGPVFYRRGEPCRDGAEVTEVVQVGAAAEAGRQWGLSLGYLARVAAVPRDGHAPCPASQAASDDRRRWHFSPLYTRFDDREAPRFVHRSVVGTQAVAGPESSALSLGAVSATLFTPPPDAFCSFRYDASDPTGMRFTVWTVRPGEPVPEDEILKEVQP